MENLFYSKSEKILFWVAGYTGDNNTCNALEKIAYLQKNAETFAKMCPGILISNVCTNQILSSRRYKYMRVFWAENIEHPPKNAFVIGGENDWTMSKWLHD